MEKCRRCLEIKELVYGKNFCRECRNFKIREREKRKNRKKCPMCGTEHNNYKTKECSTKCKLLNSVEVVNGCWEWKSKVGANGYGFLHGVNEENKRDMLAHRKSFEFFVGEIPKGKCVCHKCDNKKCVNPEHLWIGTQKDNIQDALHKGRMKKTTGYKHTEETRSKFKLRRRPGKKGEKHHMSKLTEKDVLEIRKLMKTKTRRTEIAEKFGISVCYLHDLNNKTTWPHLM